MRRLACTVTLLSLSLATACGSNGEQEATEAATSAPEPAATSAVTPQASAGAEAGGSQTLTATVGTADDPDAFEIALTDNSGEQVTTLPAGSYTIQVSDPSDIHNFHLTGEDVDETTTVPEVTETTFEVELTPGTYTFICDPHPRMVGEVTVT